MLQLNENIRKSDVDEQMRLLAEGCECYYVRLLALTRARRAPLSATIDCRFTLELL